MSDLSSALATALQNHATIGPLISGVISGRNFDLQDSLINTTPYACIAVIDLVMHGSFYLGGASKITGGIEIRCISSISEDKAKELAKEVRNYIFATSSFNWDGGSVSFDPTSWMQLPDTAEDLSSWLEILTVYYKGVL
jgi:hypothetical protein